MNVPDFHETQRVIQHYTKQIEIDPGNPVNYVFRSACYEHYQDYQSALNDALEVCRLDPYSWKGDHQAMKMFLKLGRFDKAFEIASIYSDDEFFKPLSEELNILTRIKKRNTARLIHNNYTDANGGAYTLIMPEDDRVISRNHFSVKHCCNIL